MKRFVGFIFFIAIVGWITAMFIAFDLNPGTGWFFFTVGIVTIVCVCVVAGKRANVATPMVIAEPKPVRRPTQGELRRRAYNELLNDADPATRKVFVDADKNFEEALKVVGQDIKRR
jgi:hypothetical protein